MNEYCTVPKYIANVFYCNINLYSVFYILGQKKIAMSNLPPFECGLIPAAKSLKVVEIKIELSIILG